MGNSNSVPEKAKEIVKKPIKEVHNEDSIYFSKFCYTKDYFEVSPTDIFLKYIDVKCSTMRSKLDSATLDNINEILSATPNLKGLKLPLRNQEIENIQKINATLFHIKTLMVLELNLQFSKLKDSDLEGFFKSLQEMVNLVDLDLNMSFTNFGPKSMSSLCFSLSKFQNLNELGLELEAILLKSEEFFPLLNQIGDLKNLCALSLRINESDIGDEGMVILSNSLKKLEFLSGLELRVNKNITNQGLDYFFDSIISKPDQIIYLKIQMNLNQINKIDKLPEVIRSQKFLTDIQCEFFFGVDREKDVVRDKISEAVENSLYLFNCVFLNLDYLSTNNIRTKERIVPVLQIITSNLRRRKYRKEIIEEIVELLIPNHNKNN